MLQPAWENPDGHSLKSGGVFDGSIMCKLCKWTGCMNMFYAHYKLS